ncbi:MAG: type II toxin-antitoxin system VapB family antitoxin [Candidatus Omnitrophica bacterium]|nr:type II toxin-antitoxin system VapB family antitoxin [Candidatus Omnitrophota bacterium]
MRENSDLDENLIGEAMKIGGFKTKRDAVNHALKEYVRRNKQLGILDLFGKVEYREDYDYKRVRGWRRA